MLWTVFILIRILAAQRTYAWSAGIKERMHILALVIHPYTMIIIQLFSDFLNNIVISLAVLCCFPIVCALIPFVLHSEEQHMALFLRIRKDKIASSTPDFSILLLKNKIHTAILFITHKSSMLRSGNLNCHLLEISFLLLPLEKEVHVYIPSAFNQ